MNNENIKRVHQELIGEVWKPLQIEGMATNEIYDISNYVNKVIDKCEKLTA